MKPIPMVVLSAAVIVLGCSKGHYNVVRSADSPDGMKTAQLVRSWTNAALQSDTYFVVISKGKLDEGSLRGASQRWDQPLLRVTRGKDLKLNWDAPRHLEVICDNCGLEKIDIMTKHLKDSDVDISYVGFPIGTAYSDK